MVVVVVVIVVVVVVAVLVVVVVVVVVEMPTSSLRQNLINDRRRLRTRRTISATNTTRIHCHHLERSCVHSS
jgi:hypothetical protein